MKETNKTLVGLVGLVCFESCFSCFIYSAMCKSHVIVRYCTDHSYVINIFKFY